MSDKFMYVIGGAPRSRTTFLMRALLTHPKIKGFADAHEFTTNEPATVMFDAIASKDYRGLGKLWDYWCQDEGSALVIKAPGYIFAREYFENNPFGIRPILLTTARPLAELTAVNARCADGLAHVRRPLVKTDCPPRQRPNFAPFWDTLNDYERACARCMWHTAALTDYDGIEVAPGDYRRPAALAKRLCGLAGLVLEPAMADFLKGFTAEEFTDEEMQAANAALAAIMVKLGAA